MCAHLCHKPVEFMCERVCVFAVNTVNFVLRHDVNYINPYF